MLPTFLLVVVILALAMVSPLSFVASLVLVLVERWRPLGLRLLRSGLLIGVTLTLGWVAVLVCLDVREVISLRGLAIAFGCGYSASTLALSGWHLVRRLRFGVSA
jgi:hypothetical protein